MLSQPIIASVDLDEAHRPRARRLASAIESDGHFIRGKVARLSHRKILQGEDFFSFRPHPAEGERESAALSLLIGQGMGRARSEAILERFHLTLKPRRTDTYLCDCPGIGPKMASVIQEALGLPDEMLARPKPPNDSPARRKREQNP